MLCAFVLGVGSYFAGYFIFVNKTYTSSVFVNARVKSAYTTNEYSLYILDDVKINEDNKSFCVSLTVYGDKVLEVGNLVTFETNLNNVDLFKDGEYNSFYYKNNIPYKCYINYSDLKIESGYIKLNEKVISSFNNMLEKYVNTDIAGLITCVVFGDKTNLKSNIDYAYNQSGITHLLAVSGMHIMILIKAISLILRKLKIKKWISFIIMIIPLLFFVYLCDFSPSVVRALIMGLIFSFGGLIGKKYDSLNSLSLCAFSILLFKPLYIFDAGFLLSFLCVFCIFTLYKTLNKLLSHLKINTNLKSAIALTLSAQLGLIPILSVYANSFNIFSILVNLICVPFFEFAFILTLILVPICLIFPFMSFMLEFLQFMYLLVTLLAGYISTFSWANLPLNKFNDLLIISSYSTIFVCSNFINIKKHQKAIISCLILSVGFLSTFLFSVI